MFSISRKYVCFAVLFLLGAVPAIWAQTPDEAFDAKVFRDGDFALNYRIYVPSPLPVGEKVPLVFFLHGAGSRGNDNTAQLNYGVTPLFEYVHAHKLPVIIVAPQCPKGMQWVNVPWGGDSHTMPQDPSQPMQAAMKLLEQCIADYPVDRSRIYASGISMGGFGTWDIIQRRPELFAAAVPVCGGGDTAQAYKLKDLPIWTFHGDKDKVVKTQRSRDMVAALQAAGGLPKYTEYSNVGHRSWDHAFKEPALFEWLLSQRKPQND